MSLALLVASPFLALIGDRPIGGGDGGRRINLHTV